jgi:hypothetical protein
MTPWRKKALKVAAAAGAVLAAGVGAHHLITRQRNGPPVDDPFDMVDDDDAWSAKPPLWSFDDDQGWHVV